MNKALDGQADGGVWSEEAGVEQTDAQRLAAQLRAALLASSLDAEDALSEFAGEQQGVLPQRAAVRSGAAGFGRQLQHAAGGRPLWSQA